MSRNPLRFFPILSTVFVAVVFAVSRALATAVPNTTAMAGDAPTVRTSDQVAVFSGGCFWGVQAVFQHTNGVTSAVSGYAGGEARTATYDRVSDGDTGHAESVRVTFDPSQVSYGQLLQVFFGIAHDPTQLNYQGPDHGTQYRSAIWYTTLDQKAEAERYVAQLTNGKVFSRPIVTQIGPLAAFYPAEAYHQDYATLHPHQPYIMINDAPKVERLKRELPALYREKPVLVGDMRPATKAVAAGAAGETKMYVKPSDTEIKKRLTPMQYTVTQHEGTEPPFNNDYWNNHDAGIYVDVVTGEPLFSSLDKYESGTGWPSFTKPLEPANIVTKTDRQFGMVRTEARSAHGDSHLGHIFDDGPKPTGLRYCMNSAAMRFIPVARLEAEGYGKYLMLFQGAAAKR